MKLIIALILLCAAMTASANPFPKGDAQAGQQLFEKHQCNRCHIKIMGGDGSAIFTRADRKVHNAAELLEQLDACNRNIDVNLTPQEKHNLAAYLNRFYNLK
jgi:cytochrome c553